MAVLLAVLALELFSRQDASPLAIGAPAPELGLPRLDRPGDTLLLQDLKGRVVLLEMWNTACGNCRETMPAAEAIARAYADRGLVVVHVANENLSDSTGMREYLAANHLEGLVVVDDERQFLSRYQVWAVPWSVLLDRQGRVAWRYPGVISGVRHPLLSDRGQAALTRALGAR